MVRIRLRTFFALMILLGLCSSARSQAQDPDTTTTATDNEPSLTEQTETLAAELREQRAEADDLLTEYVVAEGEERQVLGSQLGRRGRELRRNLTALVSLLEELREEGREPEAPRATAENLIAWAIDFGRREIKRGKEERAELRAAWVELPAEEKLVEEQKIGVLRTQMVRLLDGFLEMCTHEETLGLDPTDHLSYLDEVLSEVAEREAGRLDIARARVAELSEQLARVATEEEAAIRAELSAFQERIHGTSTSLAAIVELMDRRGLDAADYKQLLIRATGTVTTDILDSRVLFGLLREGWTNFTDWLAARGPQFLFKAFFFLVTLGVFWVISRLVSWIVRRTVRRPDVKTPRLLRNMLVSVASKVVMILGLLIALSQIGVEVAPLLTGLGIAGFIVGFALQDSLSNFAAGMMILFYRPFDVGDVIEAGGAFGKVSDMSLVSTTVLSFDNQKLIVPNRKIWGDVIKNVTSESTRRVDLTFRISYGDDIERAERALQEIVERNEHVLDDPEPIIKLHKLGDSSVEFVVRPWANRANYWDVYWDITRSVKKRFDEEGISIPFPQRDVHIHRHPDTT